MGIEHDEKTITNNLLLGIQRAHPADVITLQFLTPQEKFTGADWEWWLTDGKSWFGLLIQAKRLGRTTHKYAELKHRVGKNRTPQIELLLDWAKDKGIDPLYLFYNYDSGKLESLQWNCGGIYPNMAQLGCTVAHAAEVKRLLVQGGAGLPKMSKISNPLRCLVCCAGVASPDNSLPGRTHGVMRSLRQLALDASPDDSLVEETLPSADEPVLLPAEADWPALRGTPPSYVQRLIETPVEERGRIIEEIRREIGPAGALVVLREKPEAEVAKPELR
jgi:hypothetical protein